MAAPKLLTLGALKQQRAAAFDAADAHARKPGTWTPEDAERLRLLQRDLSDLDERIFFVENFTPPAG